MKASNLVVIMVIGCCFALFSPEANAQYIYGRTTLSYSESANTVIATSSTEIDFAAQDYYQGIVQIRLTDSNGNTLALVTNTDTDRDGFVEYSSEFPAGAEGSEYTLTGSHRGRMNIQDPALNYRYVDYYYFSWYLDMGREGANIWRYLPFYGRGPRSNRWNSSISIGGTIDQQISVVMPATFQGGRDVWDSLTNDEKKFVIQHTDDAWQFLVASNEATAETASRFSQQDGRDGARGNAFRHALWNALMAQRASEDLVQEFAWAHENYPRNPDDPRQNQFRNMDIHNNTVGRQIGAANLSATRAELANLVMQALNNGSLTVICPPTCPE